MGPVSLTELSHADTPHPNPSPEGEGLYAYTPYPHSRSNRAPSPVSSSYCETPLTAAASGRE